MDREKVIKELEEYRDREFVKEGITVFDNDPRFRKLIIGNALAILKEQPEIVRCKDCKWFKMPRFGEEGYCENMDLIRKTTFFCADVEAKT